MKFYGMNFLRRVKEWEELKENRQKSSPSEKDVY